MSDIARSLCLQVSRCVGTVCIVLVFSISSPAQPGYQPSPQNLKSREWFAQARFGMFIHWGIYSLLGDGEWVMQNDHFTGPQYEQLAAQFDPVKYDPAQWVITTAFRCSQRSRTGTTSST